MLQYALKTSVTESDTSERTLVPCSSCLTIQIGSRNLSWVAQCANGDVHSQALTYRIRSLGLVQLHRVVWHQLLRFINKSFVAVHFTDVFTGQYLEIVLGRSDQYSPSFFQILSHKSNTNFIIPSDLHRCHPVTSSANMLRFLSWNDEDRVFIDLLSYHFSKSRDDVNLWTHWRQFYFFELLRKTKKAQKSGMYFKTSKAQCVNVKLGFTCTPFVTSPIFIYSARRFTFVDRHSHWTTPFKTWWAAGGYPWEPRSHLSLLAKEVGFFCFCFFYAETHFR